ncbi:DinB family protein [Duganella sp. LX20W]|uniref:DinB family protein n=1 Tax=Rugamonas brunnea TaxID=2758569 RepID=A0A7W2ICT4_9BURK|nr:DinB family protein [Rugamonas brunnea]MBA5638684.1 DinB family protein [Rugamonas brunnea]
MNDHERFLSLFNQQVTLSLNTLEQIPAGLWTSIPADSETNYLGQRISRITIAALAGHLMRAEYYWTTTLSKLAPGEEMVPPVGIPMLELADAGQPLVNQYRQVLEHNLNRLRALSPQQLATEFTFIGRRYTVQGFLWAIYAHHSYHYGQIDLLLRQQSYLPPEFLELPELGRLIA